MRRWPRRRVMPRWLTLLLVVILAWLWWNGGLLPPAPIRTQAGETITVIDGDSLRIGGRVIRLFAYDAPEYPQQCADSAGRNWPCGRAARDRLETLTASGDFVCTDRGQDRYGRTLATCRTAAGDVGAIMVGEGLGLKLRNARDSRYASEQGQARQARRGVWQGAHRHPADWRDARRTVNRAAAPAS